MEVAAIKISHRAQTDMRMWPDIDALTGQQFSRPGLVEEDERTDHLPFWRRQGAPNFEATKVPGTRYDERFD